MFNRRHLLGLCLAAVLVACGTAPSPSASALTDTAALASTPPIVFVHGNGDSAALWQTTIWRFESNDWPRDHLHAINLPYPLARDDDSKPQPGRTSTAEHMAYLKAEVDKVLLRTGAKQVVLIANSRGGNAVRNYIQNGGGAASVSHAILGGTPNHGVWAIPGFREGNEFSGTGPFLKALNAPKNAAGDEVTGPKGDERAAGVRWMTIRSDNNDKFAQPDGLWIGQKGTPTFVTFAGPELKGATNTVIPRIDHRETSFSPQAFDASYRFITGRAPNTLDIAPESRITLSGQITGLGLKSDVADSGNFANNLPLAGALLEIYPTDTRTGQRLSLPGYRKTVGPSGLWGPFDAQAGVPYEFVVTAPGYAITHIYRSPFPRSSAVTHVRAERLGNADKAAAGATGSVVTLSRPRGYFDLQRDVVRLDGNAKPPGIPASGAGVSASKLLLSNISLRAIEGSFNGENIMGLTWSTADNHVVTLEITK